jgi:hypothetical protein
MHTYIMWVQYFHTRKTLGKYARLLHTKEALAGDFSPGDDKNWTKELREALKYDHEAEQEIDDGIFWISWEAVLHFFSTVHASWSPSRFTSRKVVHGYLNKKVPDKRHMDHNPQYCLRVKAARNSMVWLLLTRHYIGRSACPGYYLARSLSLSLSLVQHYLCRPACPHLVSAFVYKVKARCRVLGAEWQNCKHIMVFL